MMNMRYDAFKIWSAPDKYVLLDKYHFETDRSMCPAEFVFFENFIQTRLPVKVSTTSMKT